MPPAPTKPAPASPADWRVLEQRFRAAESALAVAQAEHARAEADVKEQARVLKALGAEGKTVRELMESAERLARAADEEAAAAEAEASALLDEAEAALKPTTPGAQA